ncbi:MAG: hypothetical protein WC479_10645 [Candidatus Izemoplasmatales bacterium]
MIHHYCEILVDSNEPYVLRLEVKKNWSKCDIILHSIRRGYITPDEAWKCKYERWRWSNSRLKDYLPLDLSPYRIKYIDRYVVQGA